MIDQPLTPEQIAQAEEQGAQESYLSRAEAVEQLEDKALAESPETPAG